MVAKRAQKNSVLNHGHMAGDTEEHSTSVQQQSSYRGTGTLYLKVAALSASASVLILSQPITESFAEATRCSSRSLFSYQSEPPIQAVNNA